MANSKIMVVDDDANICELLRLYLEKEGFDPVIVPNGAKALELFEPEKPDLILLDVMMPQLDGWQVCREIRKKSQCPIIMLTAKGEVFDKVLGLELGAADYVVKPFEAKEVIARVKAVLRRSGVQNLDGFPHDFGADAVPTQKGDMVRVHIPFSFMSLRIRGLLKTMKPERPGRCPLPETRDEPYGGLG